MRVRVRVGVFGREVCVFLRCLLRVRVVVGFLRDGGGGSCDERLWVHGREPDVVDALELVEDSAEGEDVELARLRDVAHGDGELVLARGAVHARADEEDGPVAVAPAPLGGARDERPGVRGGVARELELARGEGDAARDVLEVRRLLVAEHLARHARGAARGEERPPRAAARWPPCVAPSCRNVPSAPASSYCTDVESARARSGRARTRSRCRTRGRTRASPPPRRTRGSAPEGPRRSSRTPTPSPPGARRPSADDSSRF